MNYLQISMRIWSFIDFLFGNFDDHSRTTDIFQILLNIIQQCQYQTAHNLLLAHTLVCFYFNQLTDDQRQEYAYFLIRV